MPQSSPQLVIVAKAVVEEFKRRENQCQCVIHRVQDKRPSVERHDPRMLNNDIIDNDKGSINF